MCGITERTDRIIVRVAARSATPGRQARSVQQALGPAAGIASPHASSSGNMAIGAARSCGGSIPIQATGALRQRTTSSPLTTAGT